VRASATVNKLAGLALGRRWLHASRHEGKKKWETTWPRTDKQDQQGANPLAATRPKPTGNVNCVVMTAVLSRWQVAPPQAPRANLAAGPWALVQAPKC
jgi:hypothetical protein